jgi:hypothetical protein
MALRVRRIMACMNTEESELALAKILQSDQRQAETLNRLFRIRDSEQNDLYDLVVDTGREPAETCALQIIALALIKGLRPSLGSMEKLAAMAAQAQALRLSLINDEVNELAGIATTRRHCVEIAGLQPTSQPCAVTARVPV